jgi:hypothetical protein
MRKRVRWQDPKIRLVISQLSAFSRTDITSNGQPTHRISGFSPAQTYVTTEAFDEILHCAKAQGLSVIERPDPRNPRWLNFLITNGSIS